MNNIFLFIQSVFLKVNSNGALVPDHWIALDDKPWLMDPVYLGFNSITFAIAILFCIFFLRKIEKKLFPDGA